MPDLTKLAARSAEIVCAGAAAAVTRMVMLVPRAGGGEPNALAVAWERATVATVARISEAQSGISLADGTAGPGCRFAHPGYGPCLFFNQSLEPRQGII